ncbi:MAG: hypothetical protein V4764_01065 [Burkholderia sp.]
MSQDIVPPSADARRLSGKPILHGRMLVLTHPVLGEPRPQARDLVLGAWVGNPGR